VALNVRLRFNRANLAINAALPRSIGTDPSAPALKAVPSTSQPGPRAWNHVCFRAFHRMAIARRLSAIPRYLLVHSGIGFAIGLLFPPLLWITGTGELRSLLADADAATIVIVLMSSTLTFCPLVVATAVGLLGSSNR